MKKTFAARFWEKVRVGGLEECWEWQAHRTASGYGAFQVGTKVAARANRVAFELVRGKIPEQAHVLHSCDNRACVNPLHLHAGTHQENMLQRRDRGRTAAFPGESHAQAKLTEAAVREIRGSDERISHLARRYGVARSLISRVRSRDAWKHLK